jgi:primary-amine oxidase
MKWHRAVLWFLLTCISGAALPSRTARAAARFSHPLDPLERHEMAQTLRIIRGHEAFPDGALFPILTLHEPPKAEVLAHRDGQRFRREAFAVVFDRSQNRTYEAIVDLRGKKMLQWTEVPGVQPAFLVEELDSAPEIVRADVRWQEAMKKRGITRFDEVRIDGWAPGTLRLPAAASGARLVRALSFYRGKSSNPYARPVEGVIAVVDMNRRKVIDLIDTGVVPLSDDDGAYDEKAVGTLRKPVTPLRIVQPRGAAFEVRGHEVRWQKWRFRFSVHPREGLVLHTVGYEDGGRVRSILHRASLSEMVVPYGDAEPSWSWRNALDVGEYGIGRLASPLEKHVDAPDHALLFDADFADDFGKPYRLPRVVSLYERDGGVLWKHYDLFTNTNESRRGRELVIGFIATVGNYDYGINWIFKQDASIELSARLTGIMLAKGVVARGSGVDTSHHGPELNGHLVSKGIVAPHHQHFFNFRLDLDVDGTESTPVELNTMAAAAGPANPDQNAMQMQLTPLLTEAQARRDLHALSGRRWLVVNRGVTNALGQPVGYGLIPGENAPPYVGADAVIRRRAGFIDHQVWFTRFKDGEMNAAGSFPNQSGPGQGLPLWVADDESLDQADGVLWYTFAVTHTPRPEEWPIMPAHEAGFKLVPVSFFSRNPALDLPRGRR